MIRRLQKGYDAVGVLHAKEDKERIRFCSRCDEMFGVQARLCPRIMPLDETTGKPKPQPHDYDIWVECRNCGTLYQRQETEVEPSDGRQAKIQGMKTKTKGRGRGNNPRIKKTRDEIKDPDLIRVKRWCSAHILFVNGSVLKGKMIHNCHISTSYSKIY